MSRPPLIHHPLAGPSLLIVLLAIAVIPLRPLVPIDETRYISVAWEMWQRGDYLVMFKNGEPYSHKPPLLFWLFNLGWAVTGVTEWWPRLVSPLFSLGCLALTLSLARRLWPGEETVARQAVWILASCGLWLLFSTSVMFDAMLSFCVLLGIRGLLIAARASLSRGFAWLALAIGLGVLAKGPVILLHLLPVALLAPWWSPGLPWRRWFGGLLLAILGGAAIALAWAIPAALQGGEEYRRMIFWGQTANRMVNSFAHKRSIAWYLPKLPLLLFPWLFWPRLWRQLADPAARRLDAGLRLCLAWLLPVFAILCLISGKQVHYLVPLIPPFALIVARLAGQSERGGLWLPVVLVASVALALLALAHVHHLPGMFKGWQQLPAWPGIALLAFSLLAWQLGRRRPASSQTVTLACISAALFLAGHAAVSRNLWLRYDVAPIAAEIRRLQDQGIPVASYGEYHAQFHFAGRLGNSVQSLANPAENAAWFRRNPQGILFAYVKKPKPGPLHFSHPYQGETGMLLTEAQAVQQRLIR